MRSRVALIAALLVSGCASGRAVQGTGPPTPAITNVGVEPKTIDLTQFQRATIRYELTHSATVTIDLVDEEGRVVEQLALEALACREHVDGQQAGEQGREARAQKRGPAARRTAGSKRRTQHRAGGEDDQNSGDVDEDLVHGSSNPKSEARNLKQTATDKATANGYPRMGTKKKG